MAIREDAWLSERLGHPVFTVDDPGEVEPNIGLRTYQTRVPVENVAAAQAFTELGFSVVDTTLTLERPPERLEVDGDVVHASPEHRDSVVEIARSSFRWSRFHLDPAVPADVADRIKADWVDSYFAGTRGEHLLVGLLDGAPAGFLAVMATSDGARAIDLVAVGEAARGRGVARALTASFLSESVDVCDAVRVGTQAANVAATRLYESMGFSLVRAEYALHLHTVPAR